MSKRPLLFIGNGVRLSGSHDKMMRLINNLQVPVISGMSSVDAVPSENEFYFGRSGINGNRCANFAVQTCDLLISFGSRLSYTQTGFNAERWAPYAYKIVNDIDPQELEKDSINADLKICCDVSSLIDCLLVSVKKKDDIGSWLRKCRHWKNKYRPVSPKQYMGQKPNVYAFYELLVIFRTELSDEIDMKEVEENIEIKWFPKNMLNEVIIKPEFVKKMMKETSNQISWLVNDEIRKE